MAFNPRNLPTRIAEVVIEPDHVVISGPIQDDEGHGETIAWWLADQPWIGWYGDDPMGDHHGRNT